MFPVAFEQIGQQLWQPIVLTISPAGLNQNVLTLDKTQFLKASTVCDRYERLCLG